MVVFIITSWSFFFRITESTKKAVPDGAGFHNPFSSPVSGRKV